MGFRQVNSGESTGPRGPESLQLFKDPGNGTNLLREQEYLNRRAETASLLADMIRLYTAGESGSVREDTASQILGSIYYAVDAYADGLGGPGEFSRALGELGIRGIYKKGVGVIRARLEETKRLFGKIRKNRLYVPLGPYNDMLDTAIPEFFRTYNIEFNAQDTTCSMDYPLAFDDISATGILHINRYLKNLLTETEFCRHFRQRDILRTLYGYRVKFKLNIADDPVNLFGILFDQAVFAALSGNCKGDLAVTPEQCRRTADALSRRKHSEIRECINGAVNKIIASFRIKDPELSAYLHRYRKQMTERVICANDYGNIPNLVFVSGEYADSGQTVFTDGERMGDSEFARLTELVGECESMEEKNELIGSRLHSSKDFIDLLEADCLYGNEYQALFKSLGDIELAVLGRSIFSDELRQNRLRFSAPLFSRYKKGAERDWQAGFIDFLSLLRPERKKAVESLINGLSVDGG